MGYCRQFFETERMVGPIVGSWQLETRNSKSVRRDCTVVSRLSLLVAIGLMAIPANGLPFKKKARPAKDDLADYIQRLKSTMAPAPTPGSLWTAQSPFSDLASDYKARNVNDTIVIQVVESTTASRDGAVKSQRTYSASSSITGLFGTPGANNALQNLFAPNSSQNLNGQAQTSSDSALNTSLSGRVVEVLPNGFLVIEATRQVFWDNQHQTLTIHGVVRPGDISSSNTIPSTSVTNLELELQGKGVISDGVAPPNRLVRLILKLVGF